MKQNAKSMTTCDVKARHRSAAEQVAFALIKTILAAKALAISLAKCSAAVDVAIQQARNAAVILKQRCHLDSPKL
jgi:hypothetical protein